MTTNADILNLETDRLGFIVAGDWAALERILHDDLMYVHAGGAVQDKAGYLAGLKDSKHKILSFTRSDEKVRVYGTSAYLSGVREVHVETEGTLQTHRLRFLATWLNVGSDWQFLNWHANRSV